MLIHGLILNIVLDLDKSVNYILCSLSYCDTVHFLSWLLLSVLWSSMTYTWFTGASVFKQGEMIPIYEFPGLFEMNLYLCLGVVHNKLSFKSQWSNKTAQCFVYFWQIKWPVLRKSCVLYQSIRYKWSNWEWNASPDPFLIFKNLK